VNAAPAEAASDLVICPWCHRDLDAIRFALACRGCGRSYAVSDGVPRMMDESADRPPSTFARAYHSTLARPAVYNILQRYGGGVPIAEQVRALLADTTDKLVLDVGAGTGMVGSVLPPSARYVWLDNDPLKLQGFLRLRTGAPAVLADAARMPFRARFADVITMVEVSHHLDDDALHAFLAEAARVASERFVLVDGVRTPRTRSRILWALDLGRHVRREDELTAAVERHFAIRDVRRFRVNHDHVVYDAAPVTG